MRISYPSGTRRNKTHEYLHRYTSLPQLIKKDESEIQQLQVNLAEKDLSYVADYFLYGTSPLKQYSANELYYKTEAERDKIFREYTTKLDKVREKKYALETKYNNILHQEEQERQAREQAARDAKQKRQAEVREQLRKQQAILNEGNQRKAKDNAAAAKHAAALEQQQAHVPMNLQASAPPMEEEQLIIKRKR